MLVAENRDYHSKSDSGFGSGDGKYEKYKYVAIAHLGGARESDKAQIGGVEHQLNTHEEHDDISRHEYADGTNTEEDACNDEIG